jgi:hypothetical protein
MKPAVLAFALLALLPAGPMFAHADPGITIKPGFDCDEPMRWSKRHDTSRAISAITTRNGKVTLVLTRNVVALQLSDRTMRKIDRELHRARNQDDGADAIGEAFKVAALSTVRSLLDHSAECPVDELRDVRYVDGRIQFISRDGDPVFRHVRMDDDDMLEGFDPEDAADFVQEFRRLKSGSK